MDLYGQHLERNGQARSLQILLSPGRTGEGAVPNLVPVLSPSFR